MELSSMSLATVLFNNSGYLILMFLFAAGCWWLFRSSLSGRSPPGPFTLPLLGFLPFMGKLPHLSLHKLAKRYGGILTLRLGTRPFLIISSADVARELYKFHSLEFASKLRLIAGKYISNDYSGLVLSGYTNEVKTYRRILHTHLLSASRLKASEEIRNEERLALVHSFLAEKGRPCQVKNKFHDMNLNIISYMLFGERLCGPLAASRRAEMLQTIQESFRLLEAFNLGDYVPALSWLDGQGLEKRYKLVGEKVNSYLTTILQEHRKNPRAYTPDQPMPFVDVLLSLDSTEDEISEAAKVSIIFDILLGAVDTSAVTLEWALTELLRAPSIMERAKEELDVVIGKKRLVDITDLSKLLFIESIAKETLRLHPLAPLAIPKILQTPVNLGGYTIPKGTCAFVNFYSVGVDENYWKNPFEFRPERFLEADVDVFGQDYNLLPFGSGRRICPGAKLGFETIHIGLATLVQCFDWSLEAGLDPAEINMGETYELVCFKTEPLVAVAKPRLGDYIYI